MCVTLIFFLGTAHADSLWTKITVPIGEYSVIVGGEEKQISPSCALSSYTGEPYSFYIHQGKPDKLIVYSTGGGACWNKETCNPASGVYVPSSHVGSNDPNEVDGLFDLENPDNPYKDWTMVYLPYCTGDVFLGSKDTTYINQNPNFPISGFPSETITINHRGSDNFLFVMNYMRQYQLDQPKPFKKILIAGSSAGSYGATLNFPWVKEFLGQGDKSKHFLVSDGGVGVITNAFLDDALFGAGSSWNIDANLHPALVELSGVEEGNSFLSEAYHLLSMNYPKDKFVQYTTAYDAIQVFFLNIMLNQDDPNSWQIGLNFPGWSYSMLTITDGLSDTLSNYRYYIDTGCNHTVLRFPEFYSSALEHGANNITFIEWLAAMTGGGKVDKNQWQNLSCMPGVDCGEVGLTQEGIQSCFNRTLGPS